MRIFSRIVEWITTPYTIFLILKDPEIPRSVKIRSIIGLAVIIVYIVLPVDFVPDFIPLAGWIDDLIAAPLGMILVRELTPGIDVAAQKVKAEAGVKKVLTWTIVSIGVVMLLILAWFGLLIYLIVRLTMR